MSTQQDILTDLRAVVDITHSYAERILVQARLIHRAAIEIERLRQVEKMAKACEQTVEHPSVRSYRRLLAFYDPANDFDEDRELVSLYNKGMSVSALAAKFEVDIECVRDVLRRAKVRIR